MCEDDEAADFTTRALAIYEEDHRDEDAARMRERLADIDDDD
jgi:hypothetical protein